MKTKSLLLGSAAALFAVTGARAADAVIIPEPEAVEYVRICEAAGTGYFYIPQGETCLKISGYARFQVDYASTTKGAGSPPNPNGGFFNGIVGRMGNDAGMSPLGGTNFSTFTFGFPGTGPGSDDMAAGTTRSSAMFSPSAEVKFESWRDSEFGPVTTMIDLAVANTGVTVDNYWLSVAGLKMGRFGGFLDNGINGETDANYLNNKFDTIQYTGTAGGVKFGVAIDELGTGGGTIWTNTGGASFGIEGMIGFTAGMVSAEVVGYYDLGNNVGGVVAKASADVGPGTLQARYTWNQNNGATAGGFGVLPVAGPNGYMSNGGRALDDLDDGYANWTAEVSYAAKLGDKLTLTPGFSWTRYYDNSGANNPDRKYIAGLTADYALTDSLAIKAAVNYWNYRDGGRVWNQDDASGWTGFLRFQASF